MTGLPQRPAGLRRLLLRIPILLYRARLGWLLGHRFVLINHVGRRSGTTYRTVVEVVDRDRRTGSLTVASAFGADADWYRNLRANPDTTIQIGTARIPVRMEPLDEAEGAEAMAGYARRHPRAAKQVARFMGFTVDGEPEDYRRMGRQVLFLRFQQRSR